MPSGKELFGISPKSYRKTLIALVVISAVLILMFFAKPTLVPHSFLGLIIIWGGFGFYKLITSMPRGHVYWVILTTAAG